MSKFSLLRPLRRDTPDAWRPLDRALAEWVLAHSGSAQLANVAAWASLVDGMGDAALPLLGDDAGRHGMPALDPATVQALRGEAMVGDGESGNTTPFVLDQEGRFALWRNHAHEARIAEHVQKRRRAVSREQPEALRVDIEWLFHGDQSAATQRQRDAVAAVVGRRLFVLTGGPGTGKTTTVLRMLLMLQRHSDRPLEIRVAAPTGKAAQRLVQTLRAGREKLLEDAKASLSCDWQPLIERIPDSEALTVHRLLGFDPRRNVFTRNARRPIAADVVVIDEASMLDLGMLRALLDATRPDATLVLVGDADQLTSVAAGSVLMDLVAALEQSRAPELVRLEHSFRADRHLVAINEAARQGQSVVIERAFVAAGDHACRTAVDTVDTLRVRLRAWAGQLAELAIRPVLAEIATAASIDERQATQQRNTELALSALRTLSERQLLCGLREGDFGALASNRVIEQHLKHLWGVPAAQTWYAGRAILITRNDYAAGLFNGDVGLVLGAGTDSSLRVWFETILPDGRIAARSMALGTLPPYQGAFAITIHKSQGSEYGAAVVLLPPDPANRILSRQLLYTGLSRAKRDIELWATHDTVDAALAHPVSRTGGLASRLR